MPDSQQRSPGDTGYDPTTDPDSPQYGQGQGDGGGATPGTPFVPYFQPIDTSKAPTQVQPGGAAAWTPLSPTATAASGPPHGGNLKDPAYVSQLIAYYASLPGADPSLKTNPDYWSQKVLSGELGGDEAYIIDKFQNAWKTPASGNTGVGAYSGIQRPDSVANPYNPATWSEKYKVPTVDDLTNDPGYQADEASVQRGLQRSAASKGTVLSGGFVGRTLPRAMQDFTSTAYKNLNDRNFANYQQRYNQFLDSNNLSLGARQLNENDYNADVTNNLNQYLTRYGAYQDLIKNNLSYANLGLNATQAGAPRAS